MEMDQFLRLTNNQQKHSCIKSKQTLAVELDSIERMLMQTEPTVIAGDHESYRISTRTNNQPIKRIDTQQNETSTY